MLRNLQSPSQLGHPAERDKNVASTPAVSFPGTVHALGREAERAGEMYAGLTGRSHKFSKDLSSLHAKTHDVMVCLTGHLTAQLMHKLYVEDRHRGAPGLITAATPTELEEVCVRQAAKLSHPQKTTVQRMFFSPTLPFDIIHRGKDIISGGACTSSELLSRLSSESALLLVGGHSNSFDMRLSLQHWLCAFLDKPSTGTDLLPECQSLGRCVRFPARPTIAEARDKGWLLPVATLRAKVAIFYGCSMLKLRDGLHDPAYGIGPVLLGRSDSVVIITTWRAEYPPAEWGIFNNLINDLCTGTMVGEAVGTFNDSNIAAQLGINLCVLGDPCFRIASETSFAQLPAPRIPSSAIVAAPAGTSRSAEAHLLRTAINNTLENSPRFDTGRGRALKERLSSYIEHIEADAAGVDVNQRTRTAELDKALLEYLSAAPLLNEFLLSFGEIREMSEMGTCWSCLAPARSYCVIFPKFGAGPRSVVRCECCGNDSLNLPTEWRTRLDLSRLAERAISISNVPAGAKILVFLVVASRGAQWFVGFWPHSGDAYLPFQLPEQLPPVPMFCQVLIVSGLKTGSLGFKLKPDGGQHRVESWQDTSSETALRT